MEPSFARIHHRQLPAQPFRHWPSPWGLAKALDGLRKKEDAGKMLVEFRRVWRGDELN